MEILRGIFGIAIVILAGAAAGLATVILAYALGAGVWWLVLRFFKPVFFGRNLKTRRASKAPATSTSASTSSLSSVSGGASSFMSNEIVIKATHRGLRYVDGRLAEVLDAGRYVLRGRGLWGRAPLEEIVLVDMRQRDLTIKGQEILTADKVAIRVSIITQFQVIDPTATLHNVEKYEDRLYSDVQLAARRSLASMNLEEILTNRNRLSETTRNLPKRQSQGEQMRLTRDANDVVSQEPLINWMQPS